MFNSQITALALVLLLFVSSILSLPCRADSQLVWEPTFDTSGMNSSVADRVAKSKKWGFIDKSGTFVIAPQYDLVKGFKYGTASVGVGGKYFDIDKAGNKVSSEMTRVEVLQRANEKRWARDAEEKREKEKRPRYTGEIFDSTGTKHLGENSKFELEAFSDGLAVCKEIATRPEQLSGAGMNLAGYINEKGWMVIPQQFSRAEEFHDGLAHVERNVYGADGYIGESAYIDKSGNVLGGHWYNCAWDFSHNLAGVLKKYSSGEEEEWGFLSKSGEETIGHWTNVNLFSGKVVAVRDKNGMWFFVDEHGTRVSNNSYKNVCFDFQEGLAWIKTETGYGFVNEQDQTVISPNLADVGNFSEGLAPAAVSTPDAEKMIQLSALQNWRCEFITPVGDKIGGPYFAARHFSEGLAAVRTGLKWGFIDKEGAQVIPAKFDDARSFSNGLAAVVIGDRWGFIDTQGRFRIKPTFLLRTTLGDNLWPSPFMEGITIADDPDYFWRFYDESGKEAFKAPVSLPADGLSNSKNFVDGLAVIQKKFNREFGYINHQGKFQIPPKLNTASSFSEGFAAISICRDRLPVTNVDNYSPSKYSQDPASKVFGFIDKQGKFLGQPKFDQVRSFHEGLAAVALGEFVWNDDRPANTVRISPNLLGPELKAKWGFIDRTGKQVIGFQFDDAQDFSEGFAPVCVNSKWGFINRLGKIAIEPKYESERSFSNGLALVCSNGRYGFINYKGDLVIAPKYALAGAFSDGRALIVNTLASDVSVSTKDRIISKPLQTNSDLLNFLIENASPPDSNEWAGND